MNIRSMPGKDYRNSWLSHFSPRTDVSMKWNSLVVSYTSK